MNFWCHFFVQFFLFWKILFRIFFCIFFCDFFLRFFFCNFFLKIFSKHKVKIPGNLIENNYSIIVIMITPINWSHRVLSKEPACFIPYKWSLTRFFKRRFTCFICDVIRSAVKRWERESHVSSNSRSFNSSFWRNRKGRCLLSSSQVWQYMCYACLIYELVKFF